MRWGSYSYRSARTFAALLGSAAAAMLIQPASAALVVSDSFESYATGALNGKGTVAAGWSGSWTAASGANVVAKHLAYSGGSVNVDGGTHAVQLPTTDNVSALSRPFTAQTGTVYFRLLFRTEAGITAGDFVHFMMNNDTTNTNSAGIGDIDTAAATFGARIGDTNGGTSTNSAATYSINTTYLLVGKVEDATGGTDAGQYDKVTLWVNPTSNNEASPGTAWTLSDGDTGASFTSIGYFTARVFSLSTGDLYYFDELRVGTTFASVVPEPAGIALLAATVPLLLSRRRSSEPLRA